MLAGAVAGQPPPASGAVFASATSGQSIPFDMIGDRILVRVHVNGSPPLPFVLDTGASADVIGLAQLGGEALRHFTVIFDYSRRRMILEPVSPVR